ncbi:MAG TPA: hypothetical protein DIC53_02925 [Synergistaceae bacterium]|mgnify:CR=1 FL=1|jgi:hypothetical protein|nr:hypothetical protein [Synergistaceae bacterium]
MEKRTLELQLPEELVDQLQLIANNDNRILENQAIFFLKEAIEQYKARYDIEYNHDEKTFTVIPHVSSRIRERFDLE